jgi:hypothetical protein
MPMRSIPELDITPFLQDDDINFYQSQISILRWMVELGRVDIHVQAAFLSTFPTAPQEGPLEAVYCLYGYLKSHNKSNVVFNPGYVYWNDTDFPRYDWNVFLSGFS